MKFLELSKRLAEIAKLVPQGEIVVDIGTDHAYLPLFLVEEGVCPKAIAVDINEKPYQIAKKAVSQKNLNQKIDVRLGNGLEPLLPGEAKSIIIAGMGGNTIISILEEAEDVLKEASCLIIQSMAYIDTLRLWLFSHNWYFEKEILVKDSGKLYIIIVAKPGKEKEKDIYKLKWGPRLLESKGDLLKEYLEKLLEEHSRVLKDLASSQKKEAKEKAKIYEETTIEIRKWLACL